MWHIRYGVEQSTNTCMTSSQRDTRKHTHSLVDAMTTVRSDHREAIALGVVHDLIAHIPVLLSRSNYQSKTTIRPAATSHSDLPNAIPFMRHS